MKINKLLGLPLLIFILLMLFIFQPAAAVEIGGKINIDYYINELFDDISTVWQGEAELEFFLPSSDDISPRLVLQAGTHAGYSYTDIKYLYLRKSTENGHLTLGRQPVSWAYASVINPLDYGFGVEGLAGEDITPGVDGIRYYHSLGEGRRFETVVDYPQSISKYSSTGIGLEELRGGIRLRLPAPVYDLSFNAVTQKVEIFDYNRLNRGGLTFKIDIDDFGVYGALAFYNLASEVNENLNDTVVQLGFDSSFFTGEYSQQRVLIQGEYLKFLNKELNPGILAASSLSLSEGTGMEGMEKYELLSASDLLILNVDYQRDMFSSLGLSVMAETENGNAVLMPYYMEDMGGGFEYRLHANIIRSFEDEISAGFGAGLSYYF